MRMVPAIHLVVVITYRLARPGRRKDAFAEIYYEFPLGATDIKAWTRDAVCQLFTSGKASYVVAAQLFDHTGDLVDDILPLDQLQPEYWRK